MDQASDTYDATGGRLRIAPDGRVSLQRGSACGAAPRVSDHTALVLLVVRQRYHTLPPARHAPQSLESLLTWLSCRPPTFPFAGLMKL